MRIDYDKDQLAYALANALKERDEAKEEAVHWKSEWEIVEARLCGWKHPRDNGIIFEHEVIPVLRKELDDAREKYATEATEHTLNVNKLCGERDDARNKMADALQEVDLRTLDFERMKQERDEAREAFVIATTPETDDFELNLGDYSHPWKAIEFARKLERERDEARADCLEQARLLGMGSEREARLISERDEALDDAQAYSKGTWQSLRDSQDEVLRLTVENRDISQELDEAVATIMKIEEIFIDSQDMYDDWLKIGNIAIEYFKK